MGHHKSINLVEPGYFWAVVTSSGIASKTLLYFRCWFKRNFGTGFHNFQSGDLSIFANLRKLLTMSRCGFKFVTMELNSPQKTKSINSF